MKKNRKNEEGAVLLLLIIMMSAVVLIVASLLRFNTQNIRFAAIEAENEQALYLAEGTADAIDFYFLEELSNDDNITASEVSQLMDTYVASHKDSLNGFLFPTTESLIGEATLADVTIDILNPDNIPTDNFAPDINNVLRLKITVIGGNSSRSIAVTYQFPTSKPTDGYQSFLVGKELNYSNSL